MHASLHEGLRQTFKKSSLRPVRILSVLDEEAENYIRSLQSCVWLVGVEKNSSVTNELVRRVVTTSPGVKAVILAAYQRPNDIVAALQAGACGFLCQDIPGEWLIKSLELIAHDEMVIHPHAQQATSGRTMLPRKRVAVSYNRFGILMHDPPLAASARRRSPTIKLARHPRSNSPRDAHTSIAYGRSVE